MNLLLKPITQGMFLLIGTSLTQIPVSTVHRQARRADVGQRLFYLQYCTALVLVVPAAHPFMGALLDRYSTHIHRLSYCGHQLTLTWMDGLADSYLVLVVIRGEARKDQKARCP
jgi:hypothetical protein